VNAQDTVRKLIAFSAGKPLPRGTTLHIPKRKVTDTLVFAFVRMGGESRPWGVAIGPPNKVPTIHTVAEARDRELVGGMLEEVSPTLLAHMGHPKYARNKGDIPLPHVWLPNASHVEMLHFLAFTYTFAKRGDPERMKVLNALGRAANWLFQESTRPGQLSCIDASRVLRDSFTFPAEELRQAHTGYLLAWLKARGPFEMRLRAATEAEKRAISTSLDPYVEKAGLDDLVEVYNEAKRAGNVTAMRRPTTSIREVLESELRHRFDVAARAYAMLAADGRSANPGLNELEEVTRERHQEYLETERSLSRGKKAWVKSPETDRHSLVAASQYIMLEADHHHSINALVHFDSDLQEDLLFAGDGIRGRIVKIEDESQGRRTRAIWIIEEDEARPLRIRRGDGAVQAGYSKRKAVLENIIENPRGPRHFALAIVAGIRVAGGPLGRQPLDPRWKGKMVTFLNLNEPGFAIMKRKRLWERNGPGAWLTHRQPWEIWITSAGEDDHDVDAGTP
jgi:hypothetical protein